MTPPSTLRLGGIAATAVALMLMGAHGPAPARPHGKSEQTQVAYAFTQLAEVQAALAAVHQAEHQAGHKVAHARAIALSLDSAAVSVKVSAAPAVTATAKR